MPLNRSITFSLALIIMTCSLAHAQQSAPAAVTRGIQYTASPDTSPRLNQLDIYTPGTPGPHPVLVFIHGGSWRFGDKRMNGKKPDAFTGAGFVFVSINYRLSPAVQHPAHAQDCGKAVAWIHKNIGQYGGDPKRIYVMGHSAGAHLAALISTDETYLKDGGCDLSAIRGTIVLDGGGYDIPKMVDSGEMFAKGRYEGPFGKDPKVWTSASPVTHIAKGKSIPPFLIVTAGQRIASRFQATRLSDALTVAGVKATVFNAPDKNHLTLNSNIGEKDDATTIEVFTFIKANGAEDH